MMDAPGVFFCFWVPCYLVLDPPTGTGSVHTAYGPSFTFHPSSPGGTTLLPLVPRGMFQERPSVGMRWGAVFEPDCDM
jgi:hypothetical protein